MAGVEKGEQGVGAQAPGSAGVLGGEDGEWAVGISASWAGHHQAT